MRSEEVEEAIDMLQNCIADYVIGDFCVGKYCPMENECKDKDCPFNTAIDKVVAYISELEEENLTQRSQINSAFDNGFIHKDKIRDKIKELDKEEQELQNSISEEEREEYSDANISFLLCDIETKRKVLKELLEGE